MYKCIILFVFFFLHVWNTVYTASLITVHACEIFPQMCVICKLLHITVYLDLLNIKIKSTHLNHIPVGPLWLPQEEPLGLNGYGTKQHQYKHICQKDKQCKKETKLATTLVLLPSNPLSTCTRSDQGHFYKHTFSSIQSHVHVIWVIQHFPTQRFWWVLITTLYQLILSTILKKIVDHWWIHCDTLCYQINRMMC